MPSFPLWIVFEVFGVERARRSVETMLHQQQLFPLRGRGRHESPQRKAFDPASGLDQFNQFVPTNVRNAKPALLATFDQAIGSQGD